MAFFKRIGKGHSKLQEGWSEHREPYRDGVMFVLKYTGSHLIDEPKRGESYSNGCSRRAIHAVLELSHKSYRKPTKVDVFVKSSGIQVKCSKTDEVLVDAPIQRISFCTSDRDHPEVFAFFARNDINETMQCHAFYCQNSTQAMEVAHAVNQAFQLAKEELQHQEKLKQPNQTETSLQKSMTAPSSNTSLPSMTANGNGAPPSSRSSWVIFDD